MPLHRLEQLPILSLSREFGDEIAGAHPSCGADAIQPITGLRGYPDRCGCRHGPQHIGEGEHMRDGDHPMSRARLEPSNEGHAVDVAVERGDHPDPGQLGARCQVGLCEVHPVLLVDLECAQEQSFVCDDH